MSNMKAYFENIETYQDVEILNKEVNDLVERVEKITAKWWNDEYGFEENVKLQNKTVETLKKTMYYMAVCNKQKANGLTPRASVWLIQLLVELRSHAVIGDKSRKVVDWAGFLFENFERGAYIEALDDATK